MRREAVFRSTLNQLSGGRGETLSDDRWFVKGSADAIEGIGPARRGAHGASGQSILRKGVFSSGNGKRGRNNRRGSRHSRKERCSNRANRDGSHRSIHHTHRAVDNRNCP